MTGVFIYLTLISQQLTNQFDGLWSSSFFMSGQWELSIGRWFWLVLDRIRMGYAADPFNSYLAIFFFALGNLLIVDLFSMGEEQRNIYLINAMIFSSTTISVFLSYRYMSPTFGLSYLFSVSAVWGIYKRNTWHSWLYSSVAMCLSLGLYQANVGCAGLLAGALVLLLCLEEDDNKKILEFIIKIGSSIIAACIIYKIIWDLALMIFHATAESYNGAANISLFLIIKKLPEQILDTYAKFYVYFFKNVFKHSIFPTPVYSVLFLLLLLTLLWQGYMLFRKKRGFILLIYISVILFLPVACNLSVLMAPEAGFMIQQTCGMAIFIPVMLCLVDKRLQGMKNYCWSKRVVMGIAVFILYGNIYMTAIDLEAMYEGKIASENIMDYVIQTLIDKNLYNSEKQYFFVGQISSNPLFRVTKLWEDANSYARYGEFWTNAKAIHLAYDGLLLDIGTKLPIGSDDIYQNYIQNGQIESMPVYPADGSVVEMGDYVVVKMSNVY